MEQVGEFPGSSQKQSSKSVVMGDIFFYVYEVSALHTISLNAAANQLFNSFILTSLK